ncbi:MAG: LacI family DNA-binding transcriptional regulator [Limnochordia bacterium]|nr:LacI family DNA-binding transcriptional regulator [Limnochordia bacterium]
MSVNIMKVAKRAGVSRTTVSNYLNHKTDQMRPETAERIAKAIAELDYTPSPAARNTVWRCSGNIAVVGPGSWLRGMTFVTGTILSGVNKVCFDNDLNIVLGENIDKYRIERFLDRKRVDGILFLYSIIDDAVVKRVRDANMPFVLVNRQVDDPLINYVYADSLKGAYLSTRHLIDQGYKTIVYVCFMEDSPADRERFRGYVRAISEDTQQHPLKIHQDDLRDYLPTLREHPSPYGFVCFNDHVALDVKDTLESVGMVVPDDAGLVGFDDTILAQSLRPALSSVQYPLYEMAEEATKMLIQLVRDSSGVQQTKLLYDVKLIVRGSSLLRAKVV